MPDSFVHLHTHTEYSMLDGAAKLDELFALAVDLGMPGIGMTDHGNVYGAFDFHNKARAAGLNPILGMEAYLAPGSRFERKLPDGVGEKTEKYSHMTLMAMNNEGWHNLIRLSSLASLQGFYHKPRCLLPGQEIVTRGGMKRIEDVQVGDEVLTHRGRFRKVTEVMKNPHQGEIFGIRLNGRYRRVTWMTGEHPVLVRHRDGTKSWVEAKDVVGGRPGTGTREVSDYWNSWVCRPRVRSDAPLVTSIRVEDFISWDPVPGTPGRFFHSSPRRQSGPTRHYSDLSSDIALDRDFGYLLGLYVAEGWVYRHEVSWAFHEKETAYIDEVRRLVLKYTGKDVRVNPRADKGVDYKGVTVSVSSPALAQLLGALCGSGASQKHFPEFVFEASEEFMRAAFQGAIDGDAAKNPGATIFTQTSLQLHWQMQTLATRLRADFSGTYQTPKTKGHHSQQYSSNFSPERRQAHRKTLSDDEYVYKPVKEVLTKEYDGWVYNIEVEEDHSYVSDFAIHNCDRELLSQYSAGMVGTTGCVGGEVAQLIYKGRYEEAKQAASDFADIFGKDNFYVELMKHGIEIEETTFPGLIRIAKELGLPLLATNDLHYVKKSDAVSHEALLCIQTGKTLADPKRFRFEAEEFYLKTPQEMQSLFSDHPGALTNTLLICERADVHLESGLSLLPAFPVPEGETEETFLRSEVLKGMHKRFGENPSDKVRMQVDYELGVINQMGFPAYFLIVADLIRYAKEVGIRVGPGRGSAAGAMIAYCLGITELDPLAHGLIFERFLNPERVSMPDIDIDFDDRRRSEMIEYAVNLYGEERVAQIVTYGTIKAKAALKDAGRVLGYPYSTGDKLTKAVPAMAMGRDMPLKDCFDPKSERYKEAAELRELYESDADNKKIVDTALGLEGLKRQVGVHAAGVIISKDPLMDTIPIWRRDADGAIVTQFDMGTCEKIGLLKMDFLGLRNLTVMEDAIKHVERTRGETVVLEDLPLDDRATYKMLCAGESIGVFQLEGGPMRSLMRLMQPDNFEDISALIALYRPGPMGVGAHLEYVERKHGRKPIIPIHPELKEVLAEALKDTYQIIAYQEQVMAVAQAVAGYSLGQADLLRRAMGKKKKEVLDKEYIPFRKGMRDNGYSDEAIKTLWETLVPFADYAFNKAHSAAYGLVTYWTAYLKAHYPAEYLAALLSSVKDDKDKTAVYLHECRRNGIKVLPPDVNESDMDFTPTVEGTIRFGLSAVRNVGAPVVTAVVKAREEKGAFTSFDDYVKKVEAVACNKKTVDSLIKAGAFDSLGHSRRGLAQIAEVVIDSGAKTKKAEAIGQFDLFSSMEELAPPPVAVPEEEWDQKTRLGLEREMLGLYVSGHPLDNVDLSHENATPLAYLSSDNVQDKQEVKVAGVISHVEHKISKQGKPWGVIVLEDLERSIEVTFFSKAYLQSKDALVPDAVVVVTGNVDTRDGEAKVLAAGVRPPGRPPAKGFSAEEHTGMLVEMKTDDLSPQTVQAIKETLAANPGTLPVAVALPSGKRFPTGLSVDGLLAVRLQLRGLEGVGNVTFT